MSSKGKQVWAILAEFSPYRSEINEKKPYCNEKLQINLFVIKSVLESNCKRFRKRAKRQNFNQKPGAQKKKTHSNNWGNYTHQHNEMKEKLKPFSFIYVWTIFEQQFKEMYAFQKVPVFSSVRRPESLFRHIQGHQRAGTLTVCINIIQNKTNTVYEVESHKTVNTNLWKRTNWFSEVIKEILNHKFRSS